MINQVREPNSQFPYEAKFFIIVWSVLTVVVSLCGNIPVLVASLKYHAIKFDQVSVIIIENIAALDILFSMSIVVPRIWSVSSEQEAVRYFYDETAFGKVMCIYEAHFQFWIATALTIMICALSVSKLTCCLYPLEAVTRTRKTGCYIIIFAWVPYLIRFIAILSVEDKIKVRYGFWNDAFTCLVAPTTFTSKVDISVAVLTTILPAVIITVSTIWLIQFARRMRRLQRQSIVVNILISITFIVSFLPYAAFIIWKGIGFEPENKYETDMLWVASMLAHYSLSFTNPFIYYFSSSSFKQFVDSGCVKFYIAVNRFFHMIFHLNHRYQNNALLDNEAHSN